MNKKPLVQIISHTFPGDHGTEKTSCSIYIDNKKSETFTGKDAFAFAIDRKKQLEISP